MKLGRKAVLSILAIVVLLTSGVVAWSQFFQSSEIVVLETTMGTIEIQLDRQHAPITVANFEQYVKDGFYDGTIFHRVYNGFVIQAGGYTPDMVEKTTRDPIKLESNNGLTNIAGTVAMARSNDLNSATSQFYINLVDNTALDYQSASSPGYAVFGKVVSGMDVVNSIAQVSVETRNVTIPDYGVYPFQMWPVEDIVITRAYMKP
jgi:cyclophilin family peptidyl-prolyl cis-trans isomerase